MEIKIEGNPGTGNTFMEINIQHVEHFCPATPSTPINNNGMRTTPSDMATQTESTTDTTHPRCEILTYVNQLRSYLADEWKSAYQQTWEDILDMKVISKSVYTPGKQQGTIFNRNLVANIIHYLSGKGVYGNNYVAALFADRLEGSKDHSVRAALGNDPSTDIVSRLDHYFE